MPGHIVFVRFFIGYRSSFPYDRFTCLKDDAVGAAIEALRQEWWTEPANRARFVTWRQEREQQRIETDILLGRRNQRPPPIDANVQNFSVLIPPSFGEVRQAPPFLDIATVAGWRQLQSEEFPPHCISPRYPVARYETKERADVAVAALQARVIELALGAEGTLDRNPLAVLLREANPRFVIVGEPELSPSEVVTTGEQIQRLRSSVVGTPTLQERYLREYWHLIQPILDRIDSSPSTPDHTTPREKPHWDATARVLYYLGQECKRFKKNAPDQEKILAAFEEEGWPEAIDDPLPGNKLARTVESLNDRLHHIKFRLNGAGRGVCWQLF
ncbi:MAG TPA: hypothetical protein VG122_06385 [Gemmata sp.]|jgi:hypothetical protein|nr:hypothetical protein [Gemmata sp.]